MNYYTGCELKIKIPSDHTLDEDAVCKALLAKLPGVSINFILSTDSRRPTVAEAFVPDNHPLAGARRQDFGSTEMQEVGAQTLLGIASGALDDFKV